MELHNIIMSFINIRNIIIIDTIIRILCLPGNVVQSTMLVAKAIERVAIEMVAKSPIILSNRYCCMPII